MCSVLNEKPNYYKKALQWTLGSLFSDMSRIKLYIEFYTNHDHWDGGSIVADGDVNMDDCSGHYRHHGERARNALLYIDSMMANIKCLKNITE